MGDSRAGARTGLVLAELYLGSRARFVASCLACIVCFRIPLFLMPSWIFVGLVGFGMCVCGTRGVGQDLLDDIIFYDLNSQDEVAMPAIRPEFVDGFEILYATPGAGDISEIAGHLLLRVKLRHPDAVHAIEGESGWHPHDLVVSFLADTESGSAVVVETPSQAPVVREDCRKNNWLNLVAPNPDGESPFVSIWQSLKGLAGGFRIIMDRQTLEQAVKTYTVEQDRDLLRYELLLTPEQRAGLLAHLLYVRDHAAPPYFFFSQNCGSVLVQVVGEGIGDEKTARFHPPVAPPHSLMGNLVRAGLARRVSPAFSSYRQDGFLARKLFAADYAEAKQRFPELDWPAVDLFFASDERRRADGILMLPDLPMDDGQSADRLGGLQRLGGLYSMCGLLQEADMVFADKGTRCETYTSEAIAAARARQRELLLQATDPMSLGYDVRERLDRAHAAREQEHVAAGSWHTGLFVHRVGVAGRFASVDDGGGNRPRDDDDHDDDEEDGEKEVLQLEGAVLEQALGAMSRVAMQRGSAVVLGRGRVDLSTEGVDAWRFTGLDLLKFRDTLEGVESVFQSTRGLGIGLKVLDLAHEEATGKTQGSLAGASVIANLGSTAFYENFAMVSLGADVAWRENGRHAGAVLQVPMGVQSLVSLGQGRKLQWRNNAAFSVSSDSDYGHRLRAESRLVWRLGEESGREWRGVLAAEGSRDFATDRDGPETVFRGRVGVEIRAW